MISCISNLHEITGYEFSMVCGLVLMAYTTHIATLSAAITEFRRNDIISNIRIIAMTATVLLLACALMADLLTLLPVPVQCVFKGYISSPSSLSLTVNIVYILFILRIYYSYVQPIYFDHPMSVHIAHWLNTRVGRPWRQPNRAMRTSSHMRVDEYESAQWREALQKIRRSRWRRYQWILVGTFRYSFDSSFLPRLPDIVFGFGSGLALISSARSRVPGLVHDEVSEMGFGQIMALVLLTLQFLVVAETYRGM